MRVVLLLALAAISASLSASSDRAKHPIQKLFYFPMFANTYEPIDIESSWDMSGLAKENDEQILSVLSRHDEPSKGVNKFFVRVKIVLRDKTEIYVDFGNNVQWGKDKYRLSENNYRQLYNAIKRTVPDDFSREDLQPKLDP